MAVVPILLDASHNNLLEYSNPEFSKFFRSLNNQGFHFEQTPEGHVIDDDTLKSPRIMILGVPQTSYYYRDEINAILRFVRRGGSLLVFSRYGGDLLQKTNLNELISHFGIYVESTVVCSSSNLGIKYIPILTEMSDNYIMRNVKKLVFPGSCTIQARKDAHSLCNLSSNEWVELYNSYTFSWERENFVSHPSIAAFSVYGQGHVVVLGTPDFLNDNSLFGISSLDNYRFFVNIMKWLTEPVSEKETQDWMLQQLGTFSEELIKLNRNLEHIFDKLETLDKRLRDLEFNFYKSQGVHFPPHEKS